MRKKNGAPPFLHRPPACLALFAEDGTDNMGRDKVVEAEARDIQRRLSEQLTQVWAENATFQRLMYKNRNQHRRAVYYRRLSQVRRDLQLLQSLGLVDVVESFVQWAVPGKQRAAPTKAASSYTVLQGIETKALHRSTVQRRLLGSARLLQQMAEPILDASCQIAGLLSQSFFMPFALTMLALLARVRVLLLQVFYEVVAAFNLVAATSQQMQLAAPISAHSQNIANEDVPVMLECHWDGVKLVLYEKLPPPPPPPSPTKLLPLPIFVSDTTLLPAVGWFIEDRSTISKEKLLDTETAVLYEREEGLLLEASLDKLQCIGEDAIDTIRALKEPDTRSKVTSQVEQPLTEVNLEGETIPIRLKLVGEEVLADNKVFENETLEDVLSGGEHLFTSSSEKRVAYISVQLGPPQIQSPSPVGCITNDRLAMNFASIREGRNFKLQGKFPAHRSRGLLYAEGSSQREGAVDEETSRAQPHLQVESRKVPLEPILSSPKNVDFNLEMPKRAGGAMARECDAKLSGRNMDTTSEADIHMCEDGSSLQMKNSEPGVEIAKDMAGLICVQESERTCLINSVTYVSTGYNQVEHDNASEAVDSPAGIQREQVDIYVDNDHRETGHSEVVLNIECENETSEDVRTARTGQVPNSNWEPTLIHNVMEHEPQISGLSPILENYGSKSESKLGDTSVTSKDPVRLFEETSIRDVRDITTEASDAVSGRSCAAPHGSSVQHGTYILGGGSALRELENYLGKFQEHECGAVEDSWSDKGQVGQAHTSGHLYESSRLLDIGCDDEDGPKSDVTSSSGAFEGVENIPVRSLTDPQALDMKAGTSSVTSNIDVLIDSRNQQRGNEIEAQGTGVVEVPSSQHEAQVSGVEAASISGNYICGTVSSDLEDRKLTESRSSTPIVISSMQGEIIPRVGQTTPSTGVATSDQGKDIVEHADETGPSTPPGSSGMEYCSPVQSIQIPEAVGSGSILTSGITSSKALSWFKELDSPRKKQGSLVESKSRKARRKASKLLKAAKGELDKNNTSNIRVYSSTLDLHTNEPAAPAQSFGLLSGSGAQKEAGKERKKDPEDQKPKRMKMDDIFDMLLGN